MIASRKYSFSSEGEPLPPGALDLLNRMHDIQRPPEPGFWPPAPGWWLVAGLGLLALAVVVVLRVRRRRRYAPIRDGLQLLERWYGDVAATRTPASAITELNALFKRVARHCHPQTAVAPLHGERWLQFLAATGPQPEDFREGAGRLLGGSQYQTAVRLDAEALYRVAQRWLRAQSPPAGRS